MPERVFTGMVYLLYAVLLIGFLLEALFPKWCWKTFESWKSQKEPPKAYFLMKRVTGIVGMVVIGAIAWAPTLIAYFDK